MSVHLFRQLERLKRAIVSLGALVEEAIGRSVKAVTDRDDPLALAVIDADAAVDRQEVEVEEECLKVLALYQPVAADLRFIVATLKMNNDLERMADLAVNIAKSARILADADPIDIPPDFAAMADRVRSMVRRSLDALVNLDDALAHEVCADDDEVDAMRKSLRKRIEAMMRSTPQRLEVLMALLMSVGHLERLADMATNIAEDVIYTIEGRIIRHGGVGRTAAAPAETP